MSSSNLMIQFPFEKVSVLFNSIKLVFWIMGLVEILLLGILVLDRKRVYSLFLKHLKSQSITSEEDHTAKTSAAIDNQFDEPLTDKSGKRGIVVDDEQILRSGDAELVLRSLGLISGDVKQHDHVSLDTDDGIYNIFEGNRNPRFDEVREAFDVFDRNKDGFIDADELQKVMCDLSLKEGLEVENCRMMIRAFDDDGDGKISLSEFVKLMENSSS